MKRTLGFIVTTGLLIAGGLVAVQAAQAAPGGPAKPEKVTICHRTHSVTNPYRMITVAKTAVNGPLNTYTLPNSNPGTVYSNDGGDHAGYLHNGYQKQGNNYVPKYPVNPKVFTPSPSANYLAYDGTSHPASDFAGYAGANKVWQDIIPPFSVDVAKGALKVGSYNGLNWSAEGQAIYFGTGSGFGLCKKMSAKEFYDSEVASGQPSADVLKEIRDQKADEDRGLQPNKPSDIPNEAPIPAGPTPPSELTDGSITQAIGGKVWYDDNHNGVQDNGELPAVGVSIDLADPTASVGVQVMRDFTHFHPSRINAAGFAAAVAPVTITATTDSTGTFFFENVPEGEWSVVVVTPSGYTYTYDSAGASDGSAPTMVPAGSVGYMWAGLISSSSSWTPPTYFSGTYPSTSSTSTTLSNTGISASPWMTISALALIAAGIVVGFITRASRGGVKRHKRS